MPQQLSIQQIRQNFFDVADLKSQQLPKQKWVDGSEYQFEMPKAGIGAYAIVSVNGSITIGGSGGVLALSKKAPFNLLREVDFDDYVGINRCNADGWQLYERELGLRYGFDPSVNTIPSSYDSSVFTYGIGGSGGAAGTYDWVFSVIVPFSLHENTTEGTFPFTIPDGQNMLTVNLASLVGSTLDSPIIQTTSGFTVTVSGNVQCTYYYWDVPAGTVLPVQDFNLVHELRKVRQTSNIAAGMEKTFTLATGRTYYQIIEDLVLNGSMDSTDVTDVRFILNGGTPTLDEDILSYWARIRRQYNRNMPAGVFYFPWWRKPWTPDSYGSLETGLTLSSGATVSGTSYVSILAESLYQTSKFKVQ